MKKKNTIMMCECEKNRSEQVFEGTATVITAGDYGKWEERGSYLHHVKICKWKIAYPVMAGEGKVLLNIMLRTM